MNKPQILIVEDDNAVANLIAATLETQDYAYKRAQTGAQAVLEAVSCKPDVVLLDLGLPDMDGVEIIKKIRSWSAMPIIVVSARSEDFDKVSALDAGADFQKAAEPLCLVALEGGQLIDDHHIVVEWNAALLNEPLDILPVDDVHADPLPECCFALGFRTDCHRVGQPMQMIPLVDLRRPGVSGNTQRCDNQHLANLEAVEAEVEDGGKRDDAFAKPHVEEHRRDGMLQDEVRGIRLVVMRLVFH